MQAKSGKRVEFISAAALALLACCGCQPTGGNSSEQGANSQTQESAVPRTTVEGIVIEGGDAFVARTTVALSLLSSSPSFGSVKRYLGRIKESQRSGMRAYDTPPTYEVGNATSTANVFWYASTIAHDTYHSKQYHQAGLRNGRVPDDAWKGPQAEAECNQFQKRVLTELRPLNPGVVDEQLHYLQGIIDNKTDYYSGDYENRDW